MQLETTIIIVNFNYYFCFKQVMYADSPVQVHILIILNYIYAVDIKLPPSRSVSLLLPHLHLHRSPSWVSSVQLSQPRLVCKYCKYVTRCHQSLLSLPAGDGGAALHLTLSTRGNSRCKHSVIKPTSYDLCDTVQISHLHTMGKFLISIVSLM